MLVGIYSAGLVAVVVPDVRMSNTWDEKLNIASLHDIDAFQEFKQDVLLELEKMRVKCRIMKNEGISIIQMLLLR